MSAIIAAWARGDDSQLENIATSFYHTYNLDKSLWRQNLVSCLSGSCCGSAEVLKVNGKRLSAGLISVMLCTGRRATVSLGAVRGGRWTKYN